MPRVNMEQVRAIGNVASLYRWDLVFAQLPSAGNVNAIASDDLNVRCESSEMPKMTGTSVEVNIRGHKVKQPGIYAYSNVITLTFVETVNNTISQFIKAWRDICWEFKTGAQYSKNEVESTIILTRLDSRDNPIWFYKLIGAYLEDYEAGGTLDGVTVDGLKPSIVLSYDLFEDGTV